MTAMASLLDLLSPYPVLERLVSHLPLGDLLSLSKVDSLFRAALHGFQRPVTAGCPSSGEALKTSSIRPALRIGAHDTSYWRNLKGRSPLLCSEAQHKRGEKIRGCLMCSMPVCEACIIKASFGKQNEHTFQSRIRPLCGKCYDGGTPHKQELLLGNVGESSNTLLRESRRKEWTCLCTAKDSHLCLRCKTDQKHFDIGRCHGEGCLKTNSDGLPNRVCLWCDLRLPGERSRAEARRDYDKRHLFARNHCSFDRPLGDDGFDGPDGQRAIWESSLPSANQGEEAGLTRMALPVYD